MLSIPPPSAQLSLLKPFSEQLNFSHFPHKFCGLDALLVIPNSKSLWTPDSLPFRSLIIDKVSRKVLSCGYPKFFNYREKPSLYPDPLLFSDWEIENKIDGSLVICDWVNNQFSMRTRGSASYINQANASEFTLLPILHPEIPKFLKENQEISLLLEIETPSNVIVVRPECLRFTLLDAIKKTSFRLIPKQEIRSALPLIPIPSPHSLIDLNHIEASVKAWTLCEGVVLSYNNNQNRIKIKTDWYKTVHALKSGLNSTDRLIDYCLENNLPDAPALFSLLEKESDFETAQHLLPLQMLVCRAASLAQKKVRELRSFALSLAAVPRKEQAQSIIMHQKEYSAILFTLLDDPLNKPIAQKQLKLLIEKFISHNP